MVPLSPCISLYLPVSPRISLYLPVQVSLRIVLNPASMGKDVAAVEAAVEEVLRGA